MRRRDAETLVALMVRVTQQQPEMWGSSIVGFGTYHYRYASGREGDAPAACFSPRKAVYLNDGIAAHTASLRRLGPHKTGVSCLYLKDLSGIDLGVLERIIAESYCNPHAGTYTNRAREG